MTYPGERGARGTPLAGVPPGCLGSVGILTVCLPCSCSRQVAPAPPLRLDGVGNIASYHGFHVVTLYDDGRQTIEWLPLAR